MHFWPTTTCFGQLPHIFDHHHAFLTPTTLFWPTTTHFQLTTSLFQLLPHIFGPLPPFFNLYHFFSAHHVFRPTHHDNNHHHQWVMTTHCVFWSFPMTLTPTTTTNGSWQPIVFSGPFLWHWHLPLPSMSHVDLLVVPSPSHQWCLPFTTTNKSCGYLLVTTDNDDNDSSSRYVSSYWYILYIFFSFLLY